MHLDESEKKNQNEKDVEYSFLEGEATLVEEAQYKYGNPPEKKQGEYTLEDYYALPDERRVELIDGVIYDMSAPTLLHQLIGGKVYVMIQSFIEKKGGKCLPFYAPVDVRLDCDDKTMVQPDVLILCDDAKKTKRYIMGAPDFCLEVISESTRRKDYIKKLQKYTDAGVKEYWIIDPFQKILLVHHWKDDYAPHMYPLQGKVGLALYDDELLIDLDTIADLIVDDLP